MNNCAIKVEVATQTIRVATQTIHVLGNKYKPKQLHQEQNCNNNNAEMGQEFIRSTTHQSTSFSAATWARFCSGPKHPPHGHYIAAVEQACINLEPHNAEELRTEIRGTLKHSHPQEENQ